MLPILYDVIVVAVLAFFIWLGWRKGLLLSLCGLVVLVVAFLGAGFLADTLDEPVAAVLEPKLEEVINQQITLHFDDKGVSTPLDALRESGGLFSWAADAVEKAEDTVVAQTAQKAAAQAARYISIQMAHAVLFSAAFLILVILLNILLRTLDLVAKLPGLKFFNKVGGCLVGACKGLIVLLVVVSVVMISPLRPAPENLVGTFLFRYFVHYSPFFPV